MKPTKLTAKILTALALGERVRDTTVKGLFAERVKSGVSLKCQADRRTGDPSKPLETVRVTLGRWPELTLEDARARAQGLLGSIKSGVHPTRKVEAAPAATDAMTVAQMLEAYARHMATRSKPASARSIAELEYLGTKYLSPIAARAAAALKPSELAAEHERIVRDHGPVVANKAMRAFRAAYNHAAAKADDHTALQPNLTRAVEWREEKPRDAVIAPSELPGWFAAVGKLPGRPCMSSGSSVACGRAP